MERTQILKPQCDHSIYKWDRLRNGITVLYAQEQITPIASHHDVDIDDVDDIDSDPDIDMKERDDDNAMDEDFIAESDDDMLPSRLAAIAITVKAGYFDDPADLQGCAHFLEHLITMGSYKYPGQNEWDMWLSEHGGWSNAETDAETTTFVFEVSPNHLQESLERFHTFFVNPLLRPESAITEVEAIEAEFQSTQESDDARRQSIISKYLPKEHVMRKFGWGNRETLIPLLHANATDNRLERANHVCKQIANFFHRHYVPSNMSLCVVSTAPIEEMEQYTEDTFGNLATPCLLTRLTPKALDVLPSDMVWPSPDENPFNQLCGAMFRMDSTHDTYQLDICWGVPCPWKLYESDPFAFISSLLGHEGEGSIVSCLKEKCLATGLNAGIDADDGWMSNTRSAMFTCSVNLTEEGYRRWYEVASGIFQYLQFLSQSPDADKMRYFEQISRMSRITFNGLEKEDASDFAESMSANLQKYRPEHVIAGPYLFAHYPQQQVEESLRLLTPRNCHVVMTAKNATRDLPQTSRRLKDSYFGATHCIERIGEEQISGWETACCLDECQFPRENPFIPGDFDMVETFDDRYLSGESNAHGGVVCLSKDEKYEVHYKLDRTFGSPKVETIFEFEFPCIMRDAPTWIGSLLLLDMFQNSFQDFAYEASEGGLFYSVDRFRRGYELRVHGFHQHLFQFAERIVQDLRSFNLEQKMFDTQKEKLERTLNNAYVESEMQCQNQMLSCVYETKYDVQELLDALHSIDALSFMENLREELFSSCYLTALITGNCLARTAASCARSVFRILECRPVTDRFQNRVMKWNANEFALHRARSANTTEVNSAVEIRYEIGPDTVQSSATLRLIEQLIFEPFFDELRTQQRIGYTVNVSSQRCSHIQYLCFNVVSAGHHPSHIVRQIHSFVSETFCQALFFLAEETFREYIEGTIAVLENADNSLAERCRRYWNEISLFCVKSRIAEEVEDVKEASEEKPIPLVRDFPDFDRVPRQIEYLRQLTKERLFNFYYQHMCSEARRMVGTSVYGVNCAGPSDQEEVCRGANMKLFDDARELKATMNPY